MGLFDFFKKKHLPVPVPVQTEPDIQEYVRAQLHKKLAEKGYEGEALPDGKSLRIPQALEISMTVLDGNYHPLLIHILTSTRHPTYFPEGITIPLMGRGEGTEAKVGTAIDQYLTAIFPPLIDSLTHTQVTDLTLLCPASAKEVCWQVRLGEIVYQGPWSTRAPDNFLYLLLREKLADKLDDSPLNWLRIYLSRQPGGEIMGECLLNNTLWEEGLLLLQDFANAWGHKGEFLAQKQFMVFCRLDAEPPT